MDLMDAEEEALADVKLATQVGSFASHGASHANDLLKQ
jgi:hypothetical protein